MDRLIDGRPLYAGGKLTVEALARKPASSDSVAALTAASTVIFWA